MRTIEKTVYQFSELSDSAKEKARDWAKSLGDLYGWSADSRDSIEAFCDHFGVKLKDWRVGPWLPIEYSTDAENHHFRGVKLSSIDRDYMPTGYCLDCDLWFTFHDEFKRTGNAKYAFEQALCVGFRSWREDWESAYEDAQIDDFLVANEYEFDEMGGIV